MSDQQYGRRAVEVGPTGKTVADNLARLRKVRGFSTRQLAAEMERKGRPVSPSGITRMEKGDRVVTADDLVALAAIFGVSPSALLLPLSLRPDIPVEVTGGGVVSAEAAWAWAHGRRPLRLTEGTEETELLEHQLYGLPQWLRDVQPVVRTARFGGRHGSAELKHLVEEDEKRAQERRAEGGEGGQGLD